MTAAERVQEQIRQVEANARRMVAIIKKIGDAGF